MSSGSLPREGGGVLKLPESHIQSPGLFAIKLELKKKGLTGAPDQYFSL